MGALLAAAAGIALKIWLAFRRSTERMLGRAEATVEGQKDTIKAAQEAANERDKVSGLPDDAVDRELRQWSKRTRE